jgi:hypothetical protein
VRSLRLGFRAKHFQKPSHLKNQLVSNDQGSQHVLWHSKSHLAKHVLRDVHVSRMSLLHPNKTDSGCILLGLGFRAKNFQKSFHPKIDWCPTKKLKSFMVFEITLHNACSKNPSRERDGIVCIKEN